MNVIIKALLLSLLAAPVAGEAVSAAAQGLDGYMARRDENYQWKRSGRFDHKGLEVVDLKLTSQVWQGRAWKHNLRVVLAPKPEAYALLFLAGSEDGSKSLDFLSEFVRASGMSAAVLTNVPNQPDFDGRKENALMAFTFHRYLETGDDSWPVIFPMVRAAARAMDTLTAFSSSELGFSIDKFILSGASKRGWTAWLSAAVDSRVQAIAPMVFDMLNMREQIRLAQASYGKESEKIADFSRFGIIDRIDEPRTSQLRTWVDPYSYVERLNIPKLILLGTNDPYWVVDSLNLYFDELKGRKHIYYVPNGTHSISSVKEVRESLASWASAVRACDLPRLQWRQNSPSELLRSISITADRPILNARLWRAESAGDDFRGAKWSGSEVRTNFQKSTLKVSFEAEEGQNMAYFVELTLEAAGQLIRLSSPITVIGRNRVVKRGIFAALH
ncbi:MAG: PhoPQ-activated pathogenicity-like protein PqaA type [Deltaproteobacteria bacterium]|nr:PhoPQ-activated pathogenicity-like protein PqaA type [Deltaproteobacteria bacterium]